MKLISHATRGSAGAACNFCNQLGLAEYVLNVRVVRGTGPDVVELIFKVPDLEVPRVWRKLGNPPETCPVQHMKG